MGRQGWRLVTREGDSVATVFTDEYTEDEAKKLADSPAMVRMYGTLTLKPVELERDNRW